MSEFKTKMEDAALLVAPEGIIDVNNAPAFHEAVSNSMAGVTEVIFDFADLDYISSAGLRVLLATQKALGVPGAVHVRNASADILEVLTITKLSQFMTIE